MKNCHKKLKEVIENVVLNDIEDNIDEIFAIIAKDKKANDEYSAKLEELHEMRDEFNEVLDEIENRELDQSECVELYNEIMDMISEDEA